jgi:acetyltransferase-like isoleucine patch superfamily enzyme
VRQLSLLRTLQGILRRWRLWAVVVRYRIWGIEGVNEALTRMTIGVADMLAQFGATVGEGCVIHGPLIIHNARDGYCNLRIGDRVHIGRQVLLDLTDKVVLQDESVISMNCALLTHQDVGQRALRARYPGRRAPVAIGQGAYLGANAVVLPGCRVGARTVVGAGAVVAKPLPDDVMAVGVPARVVKAFAATDDASIDQCY